ncbi:ribonucleotide reductase inhibitor [Ophiostoma piceae UAMH 11346]|uniref:Ribonucleotide reductase inhibitor n=1 Tax=Ophiostoma piceae (strain UAMH 11346) TaxID=1262450 RepID=S3C6K3_OPHP1|nr:ribonucleotide reductase inhibitor [Ophiostoma piceae UAMH 11346]
MATPAVDQTYGQRSVFGSLGHTATAPVDDDIECEDEQDALAYLMLVRSEANKIPHVMVAPRPGPQAFPPGYAEAKEKKEEAKESRRKRNKRRQRHWDDQDDVAPGDANEDGAKRRRTAELSYDEVSYDDLYDERAGDINNEEKEEKVGERNTAQKGTEEGEYDCKNEESDEEEPEDDNEASTYHRQALYETGVGDARGYYHDGAYVAAEETSSAESGGDDPASSESAFSTAYRERLLAHFTDMRAHLTALSGTADGGDDTEVGPLSVRSGVFKNWLHLLRTIDPRPAQVAAMDKVSVLRLLRIVQRGLEAGASTSSRSSRAGRFVRTLAGGPGQLDMSPRTIRWLWALFSRLPDRGELDYREVGYIRDVAKQAVMRLAHLSYDMSGVDASGGDEGDHNGEEAEYEYEGDEGDEEDGHADGEHAGNGLRPDSTHDAELDAEDIAMDIDSEQEEDKEEETTSANTAAVGKTAETQGKAGTIDSFADSSEDLEMQQRAALEMVLAVAGEFYGQRDLLAFRSPWTAAAN